MTPLRRHLQLRPHGDHLLTSSAAYWLFSARAIIVTMALSEAVAWGRLGYVFGERSIGWIAAAAISTAVLIVVWMIDTSLITMDRAWREHAAAILGHKTGSTGQSLRVGFTVMLRVALLFGSLYITAPYLAQMVFYKDIQRHIDNEAIVNIDRARSELTVKLDSVIEGKSAEIATRRSALEKEVAGGGLSGRYGFGPAAQTIAEELKKQEAEREQLVADKAAKLATFGSLARDWRTNRNLFASSYNVSLPQTSILENTKALAALRRRPEYQSTEIAVKGFLAFVFFGLLLLKLFEPASIRLYMSEVLQQEYVRYLAGSFDEMLPDTERSTVTPSPMTPQRLYDFLANEWSKDRHLQVERDRRVAHLRAVTRGVDEFTTLRTQLTEDVCAAAAAYDNACGVVADARQSLIELDSAMDIAKAGKREYEQQITLTQREGKAFTSPASRRQHLKLGDELHQKLTEANQLLDRLRETKPAEQRRLARALEDEKYWQKEVDKRRGELAAISRQIKDLKVQAIETGLNSVESPVH